MAFKKQGANLRGLTPSASVQMINFAHYHKKMRFKDTFFSRNHRINLRGQLLDLSVPRIMGIVNLSSDSFYSGSRFSGAKDLLAGISLMVAEGVDIIDVGAVSSRPGAEQIPEAEELKRLIPAMETIREHYPELPVSLDTSRSAVAAAIIERFGIEMINDITSGDGDPAMYDLVAGIGLPYILMHMQGNPATMQIEPRYGDVTDEVLRYLAEKVYRLRNLGVNDLLIDPGFGFGKTGEHNFSLLQNLDVFRSLELPIVVGLSRKSMIYKTLGTGPENALNGTSALHMAALMKGASILRVHDVKEAVEVVSLFIKLNEQTLTEC
jgi:dihydropteroate synthase